MTSTAPRRLGLLAVAAAGAWLGTRLVAGGQGRRQARTAPWPPVPSVPRPAPMPAPTSAPTPVAQAEPGAPAAPVAQAEPVAQAGPGAAPEVAPERAIIVPPPPPPVPAPPVRRERAVTVAAAAPGAVLTRPLPPEEVAPPEPEPEPGLGASAETTAPAAPTAGDGPAWVEPIGTACPPTHPVKAKLSSHLYHLPGMLAYRRTHPDRCYRDAEAAERDGFVRAKR